jgi:hypothetical protein
MTHSSLTNSLTHSLAHSLTHYLQPALTMGDEDEDMNAPRQSRPREGGGGGDVAAVSEGVRECVTD